MTQCPVCKLYGPDGLPCQFAPEGEDHAVCAELRATDLEWAYMEMKRRGWGFMSNGGSGFGDPLAQMTLVGPYDGTTIEVYGADTDPVVAVKKAMATAAGKAGLCSSAH